jgi:hypothetical protein
MKLNRRTFLAGTTGLAAAITFPASGAPQLAFDDGFENGIDDNNVYGKSTNGSGTLEVVTTRSREGGRSLHTKIVHAGTGDFRQEVRVRSSTDGNPSEGSPFYWLGLSIYVPSTSLIASQSVVVQWHEVNASRQGIDASPVIGIRLVNNQWTMTSWAAGGANFGNVARDEWTDLVFRILWRTNKTGSIQIWKNGAQVLDRPNVQTTWEGENEMPFLKLGRYSSAWKQADNPDPDGAIHETYHDAVRIASGDTAVYADVAPRGDGSSSPMPPEALIVE